MRKLTDFEKFQKERETEFGSYNFFVSREKKKWIYVHPDCTKTVIGDTFFEFAWSFIKKKFDRL